MLTVIVFCYNAQMELRHLRYYVAVASELSFSRAAEKLLVAQPALSTQIAQLEKELGVTLLWRNRRLVKMTAAGQAFLEEARGILGHAEAAQARVLQVAQGVTGRLSIGYFAAPTMIFLPELIRRYRERYPKVSLELRELTPDRQLEAFEQQGLDLGFTRPIPPGYPGLATWLLFEEKLVVAVADTHPLAGQSCVSLADLALDSFVLLNRSEASGLYDLVIAACMQAGFSPRIVAAPPLMSTVTLMVAAEQGISLVPEGVQNLRRHQIRYLKLTASPTVPLVMSWQPGSDSPPCHRFRELVEQHMTSFARAL